MTNINCSSGCKHQVDGKCTLDGSAVNMLSAQADCVYFEEKDRRNESKGPVS